MASYTVDTDGTSGDYASLSAAIAAIDDAALTENVTITCYATTSVDDTNAVDMSAIDTTASYRLTIVSGDSNYRLYLDVASAGYVTIGGGFGLTTNITLNGLHIVGHGNNTSYQYVLAVETARDGEPRILNCKIENESHANRERLVSVIIAGDSYAVRAVFANNLLISRSSSSHAASGIVLLDNDPDVIFYNNTFVGTENVVKSYYAPVEGDDDNSVFKNNIFQGLVDSGFDPGTADYNAFSGAFDFGGANDRSEQTFTFVDTTDYRLASGDAGARDHGVSLASDGTYAFNTDIDGNTRSGTWDIGCSEYVAAGGIEGSASDGFSTGDSVTASWNPLYATSSDSVGVNDSVVTIATWLVNATEGTQYNDAPNWTATISVSVSDGISLNDATKSIATYMSSVSDGISGDDSTSTTRTIVVNVADGSTFDDVIASVATLLGIAADGISVSDSVSQGAMASGLMRATVTSSQASVTITAYVPSGTVTVSAPSATVT